MHVAGYVMVHSKTISVKHTLLSFHMVLIYSIESKSNIKAMLQLVKLRSFTTQ